MKVIRKIQFTGKNLNDVFNLPCVKKIHKYGITRNGATCDSALLVCYNNKMRDRVYVKVGETLVEYDTGLWDIIPATIK